MENPFKKIIIGAAILGSVAANEGVKAQNGSYKESSGKEKTVELKTKWAETITREVINESSKVENLHQAEEFERRALLPFLNHLGVFAEGAEETANYSFNDYQNMYKNFQTVTGVFSSLEKKFGFDRNSNWVVMNRLLNYKSSKEGWQEMKKIKDYSEHPENIDK